MPEKQADDVTTTRKTKRRLKLFWNIFRDVTNDTTNKEPRPEVPPQGPGKRGRGKPSRRKRGRKAKCNFKNQGDIMHACNKMTCNQKTSNSKRTRGSYIYPWDVTNAPSSRNRAPRFQEEEKKKGRYKLLLYRKGATTALEELERDVASWTLDFNKKANRMLVEREIFLEVKRTRDQLHGPELESTLERLSRRYKR